MTPTPKHQRCGHLAAGPDGFPCPHPTCWPGGVLQVVPLPEGPEEFWERLLYVPRGGAMFFGWRLVGEVATAPTGPLEPILAFGDGAMVATKRNVERIAAAQQQVVHEMAGEVSDYLKKHPEQVPGRVETKPKKRGK